MSRESATGRWVCVVDRRQGGGGLVLHPEAGFRAPATATEGPLSAVLGGSDDASDCLEAVRARGSAALRERSGAFALVLWDAETRTLLCARDAVGLHPLFYADACDTTVVSPFVESLVRRVDDVPAADPVAVAAALIGPGLEPSETYFTGVRRILPGHALELSATGTRTYRYWDPGEPGSERTITAREAAERFDELLRRAVDRHVGEGRAGVYLSGGIDSAAVAAVAAETSAGRGVPPPLGLALMVDDPDLDEEGNQRAVVSDLGLALSSVSIEQCAGRAGLLAAALEVTAAGSAGPAQVVQPVYDHLAREAVRRGAATILNGQGGDEWLMPSPDYAADRIRALDARTLYRLWQAWWGYLPFPSTPAAARRLLWTWGAKPFVQGGAVRVRRGPARDALARRVLATLPSWIAREPALRQELVERTLIAAALHVPIAERCRAARRALLDRPDRPGETEEWFGAHRRLGIPVHMPLLDATLVEFVYRLPIHLLIEGGRAKALARHVVAGRLPSFAGRWPRTVSGEAYYGGLCVREAPGAWRRAGGAPLLGALGLVDEPHVARLIERGLSVHDAWLVWSVTNLDVWLRCRLDASLPEALASSRPGG